MVGCWQKPAVDAQGFRVLATNLSYPAHSTELKHQSINPSLGCLQPLNPSATVSLRICLTHRPFDHSAWQTSTRAAVGPFRWPLLGTIPRLNVCS